MHTMIVGDPAFALENRHELLYDPLVGPANGMFDGIVPGALSQMRPQVDSLSAVPATWLDHQMRALAPHPAQELAHTTIRQFCLSIAEHARPCDVTPEELTLV